MKYILSASGGKDTCLLAPLDIIHGLQPRYDLSNTELQGLLEGLAQENYIGLVNSDKNGELIYCINICSKGKSFIREEHNIKKSWTTAIIRTVLLAILSFVVGLILKAIF
jgi:hypothetical protein